MDRTTPDEVSRRIFANYEAAELITECAWCGRVKLDEEWPLAPRAALLAIDEYSVTHGICPSCLARLSPHAA